MLNQELEILLEKIARGDETAFALLYDRTNKILFSLLIKMLGDRATAEEVLVNAYAAVWKQAPVFKPQNNSAFAWLILTARSEAVGKLPAKTVLPQLDAPPDSLCGEILQSPKSADGFIYERQKIVASAMKELLPQQRQILEMAYFSCLNEKEISERLRLPLEIVKRQLSAAMCKLKERLQISQQTQ